MKHPTLKLLFCGFFAMSLSTLAALLTSPSTSLAENADDAAAEPAPPANQTFIGSKKCAACHFDQFLIWRGDKHAKAYEILPSKYKKDASCLKCHTTGFGEPTGFKTAADTHLAGVTCESCHGPGSEHEKIAKPFANVDKLTPEQTKLCRDSIYLMLPKNVCITCHTSKAHKPHPKYDK